MDLTYIPLVQGEQGSGTVIEIYYKQNVQESDQRRYWCVSTSFLDNPPAGKRKVNDTT